MRGNKLKAEWGINFKYNGGIHINIDRVWVVTKHPLPTQEILQALPVWDHNPNCTYWPYEKIKGDYSLAFEYDLCKALSPAVRLAVERDQQFRARIKSIVSEEIPLALSGLNPQKAVGQKRKKRGLGLAISVGVSLVTLAAEALNSHLQRKRQKAIERSVVKMQKKDSAHTAHLRRLEDDFVMYGDYNLEGITSIVGTAKKIDKRVQNLEEWIRGDIPMEQRHVKHHPAHRKDAIFLARLSSYLEIMKEQHLTLGLSLIRELEKLLRGIDTLSKGYLSNELVPFSTLKNITDQVQDMVGKTHPDYILAIPQLAHYYDMKLVTFSVDETGENMYVTFPIFLKQHHTKPLWLYEIETAPVPILDENREAASYSEVVISKPYIATNLNYYIQLRIQELRMCKRIQYEYYCEELFLVKHKTIASCEASLFYDKPREKIVEDCEFKYHHNKTVMPTVLDGGNQIVLANMINEKKLVCSQSSNLAEPLPSFSYVVVNRSVLCNCQIDASLSYVMRSLGSCTGENALPNIFTYVVNMAFLTMFKEFWEDKLYNPFFSLDEQPFPVSLPEETDDVNPAKKLGDLQENLRTKYSKENRDSEESFLDSLLPDTDLSNDENSMFWLLFWSLSSTATWVNFGFNVFLVIKLFRMRTVIAGLTLQQITTAQSVYVGPTLTHVSCQVPWLSYLMNFITFLGVCIYLFKIYQKIAFWKGYRFANACTIYLFVAKGHKFVPIKIKSVAGPLHAIQLEGNLTCNEVGLIRRGFLWDILKISWFRVALTRYGQLMPAPSTVTIPLWHKFRIRQVYCEHSEFTLMVKQGDTWYSLNKRYQYLPPHPEFPIPAPPLLPPHETRSRDSRPNANPENPPGISLEGPLLPDYTAPFPKLPPGQPNSSYAIIEEEISSIREECEGAEAAV
jgi:hypothetical protein